jgi:ubiquinone/menaquinone biosynthesis C-methylase UbiE
MLIPLLHRRSRDRSPITESTWEYINAPHISNQYDDFFRFTLLFRYDTEVLDRAFAEPGRLIDLGCGTGRHLLHFAQRGFSVMGVDLSEPALAVARQKLRLHGFQPTLLKADINDLRGLPDGAFRYALMMFSVLGLVRGRENRLACLRHVRRVLQPGGLFALHVHNRWYNLWSSGSRAWFLRNLFDPLLTGREIGDKIMDNYRGIRGMFLHLFSLAELRRLLRRAGFEIEREHLLNRRRDGQLRGRFLRSLRANGFIVIARKP